MLYTIFYMLYAIYAICDIPYVKPINNIHIYYIAYPFTSNDRCRYIK